MTTSPQEPDADTKSLAHSDGEPDQQHDDTGGSDVGGPASDTPTSGVESASIDADTEDPGESPA